jgi:hypothetical protein
MGQRAVRVMRSLCAVAQPFPPPGPPQQPAGQPQPYPPLPYAGPPPQPQPYAAPGQILLCRVCGCLPAAKATIRGHRGMILVMQFRSLEGPFCRDCGLAVFRHMTAETMWQGWWGVASFFITPIVLLINVFLRNRIVALPQPQPNPWGTNGRPMDPGRPLLFRPGALIGLAAILILVCALALSIVTNS